MASTPEAKVKKKINALLDELGVYKFMPVQSGYGKTGLDYHCIYYGLGFLIETKAPGKKLNAKQELVKLEVEEVRGRVFVVGESQDPDTGEYSGYAELEAWLHKVKRVFGPHPKSCPCVDCS